MDGLVLHWRVLKLCLHIERAWKGMWKQNESRLVWVISFFLFFIAVWAFLVPLLHQLREVCKILFNYLQHKLAILLLYISQNYCIIYLIIIYTFVFYISLYRRFKSRRCFFISSDAHDFKYLRKCAPALNQYLRKKYERSYWGNLNVKSTPSFSMINVSCAHKKFKILQSGILRHVPEKYFKKYLVG